MKSDLIKEVEKREKIKSLTRAILFVPLLMTAICGLLALNDLIGVIVSN